MQKRANYSWGGEKLLLGPALPLYFLYIYILSSVANMQSSHTLEHTLYTHTHTNQAAADFWHRLAVFQENAGKSAGYVAENPKMLSVAKSI